METVIEHLRDNVVAYCLISACVVPVLVIFRKQSFPVIFHTVETIVYLSFFHLGLHGLINVAAWYKRSSAFQGSEVQPDFSTPLWAPWMKELYNPQGLYYLEIVVALIVIFIVIRFRPMQVKTGNTYRGKQDAPGSGRSAQDARSRRIAAAKKMQKGRAARGRRR